MQNCSGAFVCGVDQTQQLSYLKYQGDCLKEFPTVRAAGGSQTSEEQQHFPAFHLAGVGTGRVAF